MGGTLTVGQAHLPSGSPPARWRDWLAPAGVAALLAVCALRGSDAGGIVDTDAARHAMNGALIHDWLAEGPWLQPAEYAQWYYSRWPALSLGYHPPGFPVLEAVAFALGGVHALTARVLVALCYAVCALALFRLVLGTHGSRALALGATVIVFALPQNMRWAQDVMLEVPSMTFLLLALLVLPRGEAFPWRRGLAFAGLATLSVLTKQLAVFVAGVPLMAAVFAGRRTWLRSPALWGSSTLAAASYGLVVGFEALFGGLSPRRFAVFQGLARVLAANGHVYGRALMRPAGLVSVAAAVVLVVMAAVKRRHVRDLMASDGLYWAWAVCALGVVMLGKWNTPRYLFFLWPAVLVLGCTAVHRALRAVTTSSVAGGTFLVGAGAVAAWWLATPPVVLRGPASAARAVAADHPTRVLYAGESDGHFAFALRSEVGTTSPVVIRGDKLPDAVFTPADLAAFAMRYGVSHVVLERGRGGEPWAALADTPPPSLALLSVIPLAGERSGRLQIFRLIHRNPRPDDTLVVMSDKLGEARRVRLDWSTPPWAGTRTP